MPPEQCLSIQTANLRVVPGPRSYPVLGVLPYMWQGPHEFFMRSALRYGQVVQLGRPDRLLITHPDGIKHVLLDNQHNYIRGKQAEKIRVLVGNGLPANDGASWLRQRRLIQPAFHRQRLASLASVITDLTTAMIERWRGIAASDKAFDATTEMRQLAQQVIVKVMFGAQIDVAEAESVGRAFAIVTEYFNYREESLFPLPERWPTPRNRGHKQAQQLINQFVQRIIEERRGSAGDGADLISMLLAARDEDTGEGMSNQQLHDEVRTIFFAGYDTTSNALAWTWYMLAQYPDVERRLHEELATVLGGRIPTYEDIPKLTYLRMVVEETLRLYPPAWMTGRIAVADDQIDGYHIPAGAKVLMSPYVTHRLPTFWKHPEMFDPERFTPQRSAGRHRCAYIPFGIGPRICIGSNLAMLEMQLIISTVAQVYRLCLASRHPVQAYPTVILRPRHGLYMKVHSRSTQV